LVFVNNNVLAFQVLSRQLFFIVWFSISCVICTVTLLKSRYLFVVYSWMSKQMHMMAIE
jgi:hypothetical protein